MARKVRADYLFSQDFDPVKDTPVLNAILEELYNRLNLAQDLNPPSVSVYRSSAQSINNNVVTAISFDTADWDNADMWSSTTQPTRVTIKESGLYFVSGNILWASVGNATRRFMALTVNGASDIARSGDIPSATATDLAQGASTIWPLNINDFVELTVYQNTGAALNVSRAANFSPSLRVMKVGEL